MCDFFRQGVPAGAEMRIWTEPVGADDRAYLTTARLRDSNQRLILDDEDITLNGKDNPKRVKLDDAERFIGSIRTVFASENSVDVFNEIWIQKEGEWHMHGGRKKCNVFPSDEISVADVFMYIKMTKE